MSLTDASERMHGAKEGCYRKGMPQVEPHARPELSDRARPSPVALHDALCENFPDSNKKNTVCQKPTMEKKVGRERERWETHRLRY